MLALQYQVKVRSRRDKFQIIPLGDVHWGFVGCNEKKLKMFVDYIGARQNCYWFGMGDLLECINVSDKRFDERQVHPRYKKRYSNLVHHQKDDLVKVLAPIANKCLGCVNGNHEEKVRKLYHTDIHGQLCEQLGVADYGELALITLSFVRQPRESHTLTICGAHGKSAGDLPGAYANALYRMSNKFNFDIVMMGHAHKKITFDMDVIEGTHTKRAVFVPQRKIKNKLSMRMMDIKYKKKLFIGTGSFFSAYPDGSMEEEEKTSSYAQRGLFSPASMGTPVIHVTPFKMTDWRASTTKIDYHVSI